MINLPEQLHAEINGNANERKTYASTIKSTSKTSKQDSQQSETAYEDETSLPRKLANQSHSLDSDGDAHKFWGFYYTNDQRKQVSWKGYNKSGIN